MGLLADIFSTADTAKRRLSGLLSDPMGTLALGVTRFGEDQGGLLNMTQNAYPMAGNKTVLNSPQQIANFRQQVADKGAEMAMQAATVWHGSPHKFDKFDSSKIGTGEGAQAYGHGLYLAESPDVAKMYATGNQGRAAASDGLIDALPKPVQMDLYKAMNMRDGFIKDAMLDDIYKQYPAAKAVTQAKDAKLYKVDLPDDQIAKMLDWDKPLSEQSKEVQSAFGSVVGRDLSVDTGWAKLSGEEALRAAVEIAGYKGGGEKLLSQAGIPGIRYLDGGSRGTGAGTSNFVVFPGNEGLLQILERNGQAVK